jgi:hypothetical protein
VRTIGLLLSGLLSCWVFAAPPAAADSDGWYCVGPGYLAYEIRFSLGARAPELRIVRVGQGRIAEPLGVPLDDFQVHGMRCGETRIELWGFEAYYVVHLTVSPLRARKSSGPTPPPVPAANLGDWSRASVIEIPSPDPHYRYQLVITKAETHRQDGDGGVIAHYTQTQVWQREKGAGGAIVATHPIFHGVFLETID